MSPVTRVGLERLCRILCLALLYAVTAAIVLNLFMAEWGFRDDDVERYSFEKIITYQADRPFCYRLLIPSLVNGLTQLTPESVVEFIESASIPPDALESNPGGVENPRLRWARGKYMSLREDFGWSEGYATERLYTYFLLFLSLIALQVALRQLSAEFLSLSTATLNIAPVIALVLLPLTFQQGGYIHDFPHLLFVTLAFLLLVRRQWTFYYGVLVVAMFNKETAILLILAPWALHFRGIPVKHLVWHSALHVTLGVPIVLYTRHLFASNPGGVMEWHLLGNIGYFAKLSSYFVLDDIYAPFIFFPVMFNVALLALAVFLVVYRWREKPLSARVLLVTYLAVLTPLFLLAGWRNEVRVFYLAAPAYYLLVLHSIQSLFDVAPAPRRPEDRRDFRIEQMADGPDD